MKEIICPSCNKPITVLTINKEVISDDDYKITDFGNGKPELLISDMRDHSRRIRVYHTACKTLLVLSEKWLTQKEIFKEINKLIKGK